MNIEKQLKHFFARMEKDRNHRYKSWEHCYKYFSLEKRKINKNKDIACLHLAFYLASWGMYRGSTFLLQKDYLMHMPAVKLILKEGDNLRNIDFSKLENNKAKEIIHFIKKLKKQYTDNIESVNGKRKEINVSNTLASKILLGTLGCVPAYDRYFQDGLREKKFKNNYNGSLTLNKKSLLALARFYNKHKKQFDKIGKNINKKSGIVYPAMKLVDMYFWNAGYKKDKKDKNKK